MTVETKRSVTKEQLEFGVNSIIDLLARMKLDPLQAIIVVENTQRFILQQHQLDPNAIRFDNAKPDELQDQPSSSDIHN